MKNTGLKLLVLLASSALMASCGGNSSSVTPEPTDPYKTVNEKLDTTYVGFVMAVKTVSGELELNSTYTYTYNGAGYSVAYSEESYAPLSADGATSQKVTETGTKNVEGDEVNFSKYEVSESVYSDIEYDASASFTGTVKDAKSFLGVDYEVSDMKVSVAFGDSLTSIAYSYSVSSGAVNSVTYSNFIE